MIMSVQKCPNMNLTRGICVLCFSKNKVVFPSDAQDITKLLPAILQNFIDVQKFEETTSGTLKICPHCLYDILQLEECVKTLGFFESQVKCSICEDTETLVTIDNWQYFDDMLESIVQAKRRKSCVVCLKCIKVLDTFNRMKGNLLKKYPQLALPQSINNKSKVKESNAHKISQHDSDSDSTPIVINLKKHETKPQGILKDLKPLRSSNFNIEEFKKDPKLINQVAFVKVNGIQASKYRPNAVLNSSSSSSSTDFSPKRSFFKIKLKCSASVKQSKPSKPPSKIWDKLSPSSRTPTVKVKSKSPHLDLKELRVNVLRLNIEGHLNCLTPTGTPHFIPTKASRKMVFDDLLSSNKKQRKTVSFAQDLNEEIVDGETISKKDNAEGSPLKSLLKKSSSPSPELQENFRSEHDEEVSQVVSNINVNFNSDVSDDSDNEFHASKSYVQEIQKNRDSIFEGLKNDSIERSEQTEKIISSDTLSDKEDREWDSSSNDSERERTGDEISEEPATEAIGGSEEKIDSDDQEFSRKRKISETDLNGEAVNAGFHTQAVKRIRLEEHISEDDGSSDQSLSKLNGDDDNVESALNLSFSGLSRENKEKENSTADNRTEMNNDESAENTNFKPDSDRSLAHDDSFTTATSTDVFGTLTNGGLNDIQI